LRIIEGLIFQNGFIYHPMLKNILFDQNYNLETKILALNMALGNNS